MYRGISGGVLPEQFRKPNKQNVCGGVEFSFMSTTTNREVAAHYAAGGGKAGLLFEIQMGIIDRGAEISWLSQYPHEKEILFAPLTGLEVLKQRIEGAVIVLDVRLSVNLTSITVEQVVAKMQRSHQTLLSLLSNSFKAELPPVSPALDALTPLLHLEDRASNIDPHQFNNIDFYDSSTRLALEAQGEVSSASPTPARGARPTPRAATRRAARASSSAEDPRTGMPEGETTAGGRARTDSKGWTKLREVKEVMHDLRTGTPRRSVDLTVLSGAAKQKMEEKAKVQRAIATLAVRSGKVELACDLLELSLTNEPLPPADEKAVLDVIAEIAAEHGVPTGKNEAVVVWRVRAAQYIVRVAKCAAPWPAVLVELTQPHKLEAAKKTESRPYYPKEDGGSTREERTAQAIAKLVRPFAAETLGEAKTICKGAPVLAWDAQGSRWLHAKITEVLEQQQAGKNAQEWTQMPSSRPTPTATSA